MACAAGPSWRMCKDLLSSCAARGSAGVLTVEREEAPVAIVMGLDQHRAQITADWLDTASGEVSRARVAPADRAGVRRFLERFGGCELEVALEATTGWRFVVEELRRVGATVHLAEPAETAARRGKKKRAKNDRADAALVNQGPVAAFGAFADAHRIPGLGPAFFTKFMFFADQTRQALVLDE